MIHWHEDQREILILKTEGGPLLGMSLLWNNRVDIEARDNGHIHITKII